MAEEITSLDPKMTSEAALEAILARLTRDIDRLLADFMQKPTPDVVHRSRVALRRLTTALDAFSGLVRREEAKAVRREAKDIFRRLGALRDADVYLEARGGRRGSGKLVRDVARLRKATRAELKKRAAKGFGKRLRKRLESGEMYRRGKAGRQARRMPVAELTLKAMSDAFAACDSHGVELEAMAPTNRHEFRKDMKSLRYLSEFFVPLWQGCEVAQAMAELERLQDDLGLLNDMANARKRAGPGAVPQAREVAALARADAEWARLKALAPWWEVGGAISR